MGLMDMIGGLLGKKAPKSGNGLLDALLPMLMKGGAMGGLAGLLGKFTSAGLGKKADSWVSNGANEGLQPDEVESALGGGLLGSIAQKAGVSQDAAKGGLAKMLPGLVDQLTPGGSVPSGNLAKSMKGLDFGKLLSAFKG